MAARNLYDQLNEAVAPRSDAAAVVIRATYQPVGGGRVFPPTYPQDATRRPGQPETPYVLEKFVVDGQARDDVLLDSVQSQNNRLEEALAEAVDSGELTLPRFVIRHQLSNGRQVTLTSLDLPHRAADAYLRDSTIDGTPFDRSPAGRRLREATNEDVTPLYEREPLSVVLGMWDSQRGKGANPVRLPRVYRSEMIGLDPQLGRRAAGKMDPNNLVGNVQNPDRATDGSASWTHVTLEDRTKGTRLSEIGLGNIAPGPQHGGVTVTEVRRLASLSFAGLARVRFGGADRDAARAARVVLAALALLGDRLAFGGASVFLRSGTDLVLVDESVSIQRRGGEFDPLEVGVDDLLAVVDRARGEAARGGLVMQDDVIELTPASGLAKALEYSYLQAAPEAAS